MPNDNSSDESPDRKRDEPTAEYRRPGHQPGDTSRERIAWGLFALLSLYVGTHPFLPNYVPDPAVVGAIITGIVSLLVSRALGPNSGGGGVA